jgi:hypothetical protein
MCGHRFGHHFTGRAMNIETFLREHGLAANPFAAEEARHDQVFDRLIDSPTRHPDFAKILGRIDAPSTAVVFGEKGSGKTAIRLTIARLVREHNREHPDRRTLLAAYDDLNPVLDRILHHLGRGRARRDDAEAMRTMLGQLRLADHQDAILSLAVTGLVDAILNDAAGNQPPPDRNGAPVQLEADGRRTLRRLPRSVRADLAVLAAMYDQPRGGSAGGRFVRLCRRLRLTGLGAVVRGRMAGPLAGFCAIVGAIMLVVGARMDAPPPWLVLGGALGVAAGVMLAVLWASQRLRCWNLERRIRPELRAVERRPGALAAMLRHLARSDLLGQPWPRPGNADSRYQLTARLLGVLRPLGYQGMMVLVDRVDEPTSIHGQPDRMRAVIWPMMDNKFLQQPHVGIKLLLPMELRHLLARESAAFFQEARLDKQSMVDRLTWSGVTLLDLCNRRLAACRDAQAGPAEVRDMGQNEGQAVNPAPAAPTLDNLFEPDVSRELLIEALDQMDQPRDAFKFLYAVIQEHCRNVADDQPHYRIPRLVLESVRREHARRRDDFARGFSPA